MIRDADKSTLLEVDLRADSDGGSPGETEDAALVIADRHIAAAIDAFESERKMLMRQIEPITRKISAIEEKIAKLRTARAPTLLSSSGSETSKLFGQRLRKRPESLAWKVRQQAYAILKKAGRPLGRMELLEELRAGGIEVGTTNPPKSIGRIMWNADEFEYVDTGYWIKGEPLPKEYTPGKRHKRNTAK